MFLRISTHLFNEGSLSVYLVPGTILDLGVAATENTGKNPHLHGEYRNLPEYRK